MHAHKMHVNISHAWSNLAAMQAELPALYRDGTGDNEGSKGESQPEGLFVGGSWRELHFIANGQLNTTSATAFPHTAAVIEESRQAAAAVASDFIFHAPCAYVG